MFRINLRILYFCVNANCVSSAFMLRHIPWPLKRSFKGESPKIPWFVVASYSSFLLVARKKEDDKNKRYSYKVLKKLKVFFGYLMVV